MEGSGSVEITRDPDPRGPKTYGSETLILTEFTQVQGARGVFQFSEFPKPPISTV
jgi:hypothetical protein